MRIQHFFSTYFIRYCDSLSSIQPFVIGYISVHDTDETDDSSMRTRMKGTSRRRLSSNDARQTMLKRYVTNEVQIMTRYMIC